MPLIVVVLKAVGVEMFSCILETHSVCMQFFHASYCGGVKKLSALSEIQSLSMEFFGTSYCGGVESYLLKCAISWF